LHRAGRRAEALDAYQELYRLMVDRLGIEPGSELQRLHQQILAG
jgi:DNA-binding SARP family transcriptional activator